MDRRPSTKVRVVGGRSGCQLIAEIVLRPDAGVCSPVPEAGEDLLPVDAACMPVLPQMSRIGQVAMMNQGRMVTVSEGACKGYGGMKRNWGG